MKSMLLFTLTLLCASGVVAQETYIWKAGQPGGNTDWGCATNWTTNQVPDASADVIITYDPSKPDALPVITTDHIEINSLRIDPGARLTIGESGSLRIHNPDYCDDVSRIKVYGILDMPGFTKGSRESVLALQSED